MLKQLSRVLKMRHRGASPTFSRRLQPRVCVVCVGRILHTRGLHASSRCIPIGPWCVLKPNPESRRLLQFGSCSVSPAEFHGSCFLAAATTSFHFEHSCGHCPSTFNPQSNNHACIVLRGVWSEKPWLRRLAPWAHPAVGPPLMVIS